jgi:hypothetical protein
LAGQFEDQHSCEHCDDKGDCLRAAKCALFSGMLSLAAINRFWLVPSMSKAQAAGGGGSVWEHRLRTHVLAEQTLGLLVLSIVSVLGTIRPGNRPMKAASINGRCETQTTLVRIGRESRVSSAGLPSFLFRPADQRALLETLLATWLVGAGAGRVIRVARRPPG